MNGISAEEEVTGNWRLRAVCADHPDPEIFFPNRGGSTRAAREVCRPCPVREQCEDEARTHRPAGVWGGTTERDRRKPKRRQPTPGRRVVSA